MVYEFIREYSGTSPVRTFCRVLGVSPSAYYHWRSEPVSTHRRVDGELLERIGAIHDASRALYGSPRIYATLRQEGIHCSRKRVARLMREHGIRAKTARRFRVTTRSGRFGHRSVDLVQRCFRVEEPNRIWTSDITYLWTREGWVYLAVILDLYSRRVVGWELGSRLSSELVTAALQRALSTRSPSAGLVLHADRGTQYTADQLHRLAREHGLRQSHGLSCFDNAVTESFFHTIKTEHVYFEHFESRYQVRSSIFDYIEIYYNRQRKHSTLGMLSPTQFEEKLLHSP